jgi:UDP-N-acetylmuramoyl-tripeptide--D-alanyl-D-alanine ligase
MQVSEIVKITKGKLISGDLKAGIDLGMISTDSRTLKPGEFFLPLKGANFNGENFIDDALKKGARGTLTTQYAIRCTQYEKVIIRVTNTTDALQRIAHHHRMKFKIPVIGVTGSNGKTTVKDMIHKVLSLRYNVLKNEGTKNNHIGVPQALLKLKPAHDMCVLEMGTNHKGEIGLLADIARPDVAVITNIGPSHLEFLKDLEGVFNAKKEIFEYLGRDAMAILNGDDKYLSRIKNKKFKITRFGLRDLNDFKASQISTENGRIKFFLNDRSPFTLNLLGVHNVYNSLAAIATAHHCGMSYEAIKKALREYKSASMRLNVEEIGGLVIIDDAYNSNPLSMRYALESVKDYPAKSRWIVSADMLELGARELDFHAMVGESIAKFGFDGLITLGSLSKHMSSRALECGMRKDRVWHCSTRGEVAEIIRKMAKEGDCILVKGSRAMRMEEVIERLRCCITSSTH